MKLAELRPSHLERAIAALADTPRTALHAYAVLRAALNDAVEARYIVRSPMDSVRSPRAPRPRVAILSAAQGRQLREGTRKDAYGPLWALLLGTGMRVDEALGLTWADVDLDGGTVAVRYQLDHRDGEAVRVPTKAARTLESIALPSFAVDALREQRRRMFDLAPQSVLDKGLCFLTRNRRPVRSDSTIRELHRACRRLGLPKVTQHSLRHLSSTALADGGVPKDARDRRLGHSESGMVDALYTATASGMDRQAADALERAFGGAL
jgi:integrase